MRTKLLLILLLFGVSRLVAQTVMTIPHDGESLEFKLVWLGVRLGKQSPQLSILMGLIFIPGGATEIGVATLAMELELINRAIFVATGCAALISSGIAGPLIGIQASRMVLAS